MRHWLALGLLAVPLVGCTEEPLGATEMVVDEGHESDTWSQAPPPSRIDIDRIDVNGNRAAYASLPAPAERFSIGRHGLFAYEVRGVDETDVERVRGRSLLINEPAVAGMELPLFVARIGSWSRPPGTFVTPPGSHTRAALVGGRSVLIAGAERDGGVSFERYDVGAWAAVPRRLLIECPQTPCRFTAIAATTGPLVLAVGDTWAIWFDLSDGRSGEAPRPEGLLSYAELAEGQTVLAPDGSAYLVGATRENEASDAVLRVDPDGALTLARLSVPRRGAAATWITGHGLVVLGGSETGAAVELLPMAALTSIPLAYAPDATLGAGAAPTAEGSVLRVGGIDSAGRSATTVSYSLSCGAACAPSAAGPAVPLSSARAFPLESSTLVVGRSRTGTTEAFIVNAEDMSAKPLRESRLGAAAVAIPAIEQIAIVGGALADGRAADTIELFMP